jgi:hypothetical protein
MGYMYSVSFEFQSSTSGSIPAKIAKTPVIILEIPLALPELSETLSTNMMCAWWYKGPLPVVIIGRHQLAPALMLPSLPCPPFLSSVVSVSSLYPSSQTCLVLFLQKIIRLLSLALSGLSPQRVYRLRCYYSCPSPASSDRKIFAHSPQDSILVVAAGHSHSELTRHIAVVEEVRIALTAPEVQVGLAARYIL